MKHHFGDLLDRSFGHWTITPNRDRYRFLLPNAADIPETATIVVLSADTANWERVLDLPKLEELTLHSPSHDQFLALEKLRRLRRLRVTHHRPKSLGVLRGLWPLEELVLEYVSGLSDLSDLASLPNLRALHLENLRRVSDFTPLAGCTSLKYLGLTGTLDWSQPVPDFAFLEHLQALELFWLGSVRYTGPLPALNALARLPALRKIRVPDHVFPIEEYARMRVRLRGIEGADFKPWTVWTDTHAARRLSELDMHRLFTKADWAKWRAAGEHDWGQQPIMTEGGVNVYERDGEVFADDGQRTYGCCIGKGARSMSADGKAFAKARAKAEAIFARVELETKAPSKTPDAAR